MFEWIKARVLRLMRVPHEPEPPMGAPGSVQVFRAGLNHYHLKIVLWFIGQAGAIVGIGFSLVALGAFEMGLADARLRALQPTPAPTATVEASPSPTATPAARSSRSSRSSRSARSPEERRRDRERVIRAVVTRMPGWVIPLIQVLEFLGIGLFVVQMFVTYSIVRLEFEQHWYIVTDRSLRIRTGILRLQESTMSFANIQQVEIRQGPLQRFLGLADVCVRSAGGGDPSADAKGHGADSSLHMGVFEGVPNAVEIRDLVIERLRRFREAGLGDPEDARASASARPSGEPDRAAEKAVAELLEEARALGRVLRADAARLDNLAP